MTTRNAPLDSASIAGRIRCRLALRSLRAEMASAVDVEDASGWAAAWNRVALTQPELAAALAQSPLGQAGMTGPAALQLASWQARNGETVVGALKRCLRGTVATTASSEAATRC